ncbi:MAG: signal recognition particle-docking protein FtsY [Actinomycetota bacterium]
MGLFSKLVSKFSSLTQGASTELLADFESELLTADLGPTLTREVMEAARKGRGDLGERISTVLLSGMSSNSREITTNERLTTILVVGVNGTGKTTTVAKLAHLFRRNGKKVLLTAADTFRAAAVDQLETWSKRVEVDFHKGSERADPAAVAFDGAKRAMDEKYDIHLIDTAGRLHTESNLMSELSKVKRVIEKVSPVEEILLVLDATTGQNAIVQAKEFMAAVPITGIILTKMDGSAKGGSILAVERELQIPIKFIGTGEAMDDLQPFEPESFVSGLF